MNIDNLATQTPEEKESLDAINPTSFGAIPDTVESEWKNGDVCLYMNSSEAHKFIGIDPTRSDFCYIKANCSAVNWVEVSKLSKPETPEEKEKRERLEAAYDLYVTGQESVGVIGYQDFDDFASDLMQVKFYNSIVDKTNYRKEK